MMSWMRKLELFQKIKSMDESKARKYHAFLSVAYFFSVTSFIIHTLQTMNTQKERQEKAEESKRLEAGYPVIDDESEAHAAMRKRGVEAGVLYKYTPEKGWHLEEYHRGEYLSRLQKKALEKAREAQGKALSEGKQLPPDAILLVDAPVLQNRESDKEK